MTEGVIGPRFSPSMVTGFHDGLLRNQSGFRRVREYERVREGFSEVPRAQGVGMVL